MTTRIASATKTGRNPKFPFVPVVVLRDATRDRAQQVRGFAFATRAEAVAFAEKTIAHREEHAVKAADAYAARGAIRK
jgi:hypothetical protein